MGQIKKRKDKTSEPSTDMLLMIMFLIALFIIGASAVFSNWAAIAFIL